MIIMNKINVLIPAAGKGTRSGLNYPKTLYKIKNKEILLRIMELLKNIDDEPTIIVSPEGKNHIKKFLIDNNQKANLVIQKRPLGMGNAILQFKDSLKFNKAENILLIWGDIPFIRKETIKIMIDHHFKYKCDFTLITKNVNSAYTLVNRDSENKIIDISETRELGLKPKQGERDIGLFIFKKDIVMSILQENLKNKYGDKTGEHGFLYIIKYLSLRGFRIDGLPIAKDIEIKSLNFLNDLL